MDQKTRWTDRINKDTAECHTETVRERLKYRKLFKMANNEQSLLKITENKKSL